MIFPIHIATSEARNYDLDWMHTIVKQIEKYNPILLFCW